MSRVVPASRIRLVEAVTSLQRLRREMGRLSETDEDYKKKKRTLEAVIKELQSAPACEAQEVRVARALRPSHKAGSKSLRSRSKGSSRPAQEI